MGHSHEGAIIHEKPPKLLPRLAPEALHLHVTQSDTTDTDSAAGDNVQLSPTGGCTWASPEHKLIHCIPRFSGHPHHQEQLERIIRTSVGPQSGDILFNVLCDSFCPYHLFSVSFSCFFLSFSHLLSNKIHIIGFGLMCTLIGALPIKHWTLTDVLQVRHGGSPHSPKNPSMMRNGCTASALPEFHTCISMKMMTI